MLELHPFIGTKRILAARMTRQEYNDYRGWKLPDDEAHLADQRGYLVEYMEGGEKNHSAHKGYISWSPEDVFNSAYRPINGLTFGEAIEAAKVGCRVARRGWNGKGMWVIYVPGSNPVEWAEDSAYAKAAVPNGTPILPHFDMYTINAEGRRAMLPGWLASQSDMDANDWEIVG